MSQAAFTQTSAVLKEAVENALADGGLAKNVVLTNPTEDPGNGVSVWLYQVGVDEYSRNAPAAVVDNNTAGRLRAAMPPLGVNMYYLITPIYEQPDTDQQALAQVMLYLHENPILAVYQLDVAVNDQVRVSPVPDSLADRATLWQALAKPYRLSVSYVVRTVRLVTTKTVPVAPVGVVTTGLPARSATRG